nr:MAG TPA: hypothetical protein [Caudoviricetes sp.]
MYFSYSRSIYFSYSSSSNKSHFRAIYSSYLS